ncbi:hypothetical protein DL93DRAFT_2073178 [Clavulina sp. PMI_390]|nr:hypothetical protein DL93DRAFT_2073178 [Clavulina sp. PMI_390]
MRRNHRRAAAEWAGEYPAAAPGDDADVKAPMDPFQSPPANLYAAAPGHYSQYPNPSPYRGLGEPMAADVPRRASMQQASFPSAAAGATGFTLAHTIERSTQPSSEGSTSPLHYAYPAPVDSRVSASSSSPIPSSPHASFPSSPEAQQAFPTDVRSVTPPYSFISPDAGKNIQSTSSNVSHSSLPYTYPSVANVLNKGSKPPAQKGY